MRSVVMLSIAVFFGKLESCIAMLSTLCCVVMIFLSKNSRKNLRGLMKNSMMLLEEL